MADAVPAAEPTPLACSNCGATGDDVAPRSPDMDVRPVVLCQMCAFALVMNPELFDDLGRRKRRG